MTDTATTVHGPELGGRCRCAWTPTIPEGTSDADAVALAVDQRAQHYADVGYEPPELVVPTREVGPANRIATDEELASFGVTLPAVVERARAVAAARGRVDDEPASTADDDRRRRIDLAWDSFRPTAMFDGAELPDLAPDARAEAERWLGFYRCEYAAPTGNLIISGPLGTGKTYMGIAVCRHLIEHGRTVRWGPVGELLDGLRPDGHLSAEDLIRPDVLFIDDIGSARPTEWTIERLYVVINRRWLERRPLIVTANRHAGETPEALTGEIIEAVGARTWDRIRDGAVGIELGGASRRKPA